MDPTKQSIITVRPVCVMFVFWSAKTSSHVSTTPKLFCLIFSMGGYSPRAVTGRALPGMLFSCLVLRTASEVFLSGLLLGTTLPQMGWGRTLKRAPQELLLSVRRRGTTVGFRFGSYDY